MKEYKGNKNILVLATRPEEVAKYSSIGTYPIFYIAMDGGVLSPDAVQENLELCCDPTDPFWFVTGHAINWENPGLYCEHTGLRIESAYAEDLVETN